MGGPQTSNLSDKGAHFIVGHHSRTPACILENVGLLTLGGIRFVVVAPEAGDNKQASCFVSKETTLLRDINAVIRSPPIPRSSDAQDHVPVLLPHLMQVQKGPRDEVIWIVESAVAD